MPYQAYKFNKLQESRRPDKRSASGNFAFVIRLNPGNDSPDFHQD